MSKGVQVAMKHAEYWLRLKAKNTFLGKLNVSKMCLSVTESLKNVYVFK